MKKFLFLIMLIILALLCCISLAEKSIVASGSYDNISWTLSDDGILQVFGDGDIADNVQPWKGQRENIKKVIVNEGITGIGMNVFEFCSFSEIDLPDSLISINDNAFWSCKNLSSITLPRNVSRITNNIFCWCSGLKEINVAEQNNYFTSIDGILFSKDKSIIYNYPAAKSEINYIIPNSVEQIGCGAFFNCSLLESISIPNDVRVISDFAFAFCYSLSEISLSPRITVIAYCAFENTGINSIVIPDGVESIQSSAFYLCSNLKKITIPASVTYIDDNNSIPPSATIVCWKNSYADEWAKRWGYLTEYLTQSPSVFIGEIIDVAGLQYRVLSEDTVSFIGLVKKNGITDLKIPNTVKYHGNVFKVIEIAAKALYQDSGVIKVYVGKYVTVIGKKAFSSCVALASLKGCVSVVTINDNAFSSCYSLKTIPTMSKLQKIGACAFIDCFRLVKLTLESKVKTIGKNAFNGCKALKSIKVVTTKLTLRNVGNSAFKGINDKAKIKCPSKKLKAYKKLFIQKGAPESCIFSPL